MTWGELQRRHVRLFRDVYADADAEVTAALRAKAAWLWSGRRGVVAGIAAAAAHGSRWVDPWSPIDLYHDNRHRLPGLQVRSEPLDRGDVVEVGGVPVTDPARAAFDIACWYDLMPAVAAIDALVRAADVKLADVELLVSHHAGRRGIKRARRTLELVDGGAQSPKESWLRTVLVQAGLPRPETQIPVRNRFGDAVAYLDMGWPALKVAVEYDGDHHRADRAQYGHDIRRSEMLQRQGWIVIRVTAKDRPADIVRRVRAALAARR
jgi:very-short-patch-repair endonuclease